MRLGNGLGVYPTPHGVGFYLWSAPERLWCLFVVWPRWWRLGKNRVKCTQSIALGPVAVTLTDLRWQEVA